MTARIDRRETFRYGALGLAAMLGSSALAACSPSETDGGAGPGTGDPDGMQLVSSDVKRAAGDTTVMPDVVAGLHAFAGDLYGGLAAEPGNLVLSPYSVLLALGMTLTGAAGRTAEEMRSVLRVDGVGADRWHKGVNALSAHIDGMAGTQKRPDGSRAELALATANQLFGQQGVRWEAEFLDLLAKEYGAGMRAVDFVTAAADARALINGWVESRTEDRIKGLIPDGVLKPSTRLVLVNAIYLKAPWQEPFAKELTAKGTFNREDGSAVEVDMMGRPDLNGALLAGDGWKAVRLAYAGQRLAMTVVLPDDGALDAVERDLAAEGFAAVVAPGRPAVVDLKLPRWTFRTKASLKQLLMDIGMPTAFMSADFSPMTEEDLDLVIAEVLHQGFIAVDEKGTEAAAATAVVMAETSAPVAEPFVVDRPFLFVVHDIEHGTPLFVGRVSDPTA